MNAKHNLKRFFWTSITLVLIFSISPSVTAAQSAPSDEKLTTWTLSRLYGEPSIRLEGYRPVAALNLVIPPGWKPSSGGILTLDYRISNLAIEGATLTVWLNDQPIASSNFESEAGLLTIVIPGDYFNLGENTLKFMAFLPLKEDLTCTVPNHPGRWLEFGPASYLNLVLEPTNDRFVLSDFPTQFEALGDDDTALITFVIPEAPSNSILNALSAVGFALAQEIKTTAQFQAIFPKEVDPGQISGPVIFISENVNTLYPGSLMPPNSAESGWLSLTRPDWSAGYPVLAIGGPDGESVLRAAKALLDPLAIAQMATEYAIVDTLPLMEPVSLGEKFTLADLGYGERKLSGTGELSLIYFFDIPFAWTPENGQLVLDFVHSSNLNPEVASLTVLLNGYTNVSLRLDAPGIASNNIEVSIPKEFIRPGRNFLRLTFDFGPPVELCQYSSSQQSWASIRPETTLILPHGNQGGRLSLKDFPFNLASEADTAQLSIILPENTNSNDITQALALIHSLSLTDNRFAPRLLHADQVSDEVKTGHIIIIGSDDRQPLLSDLEAYLPYSFENNQLSNYGIRLPNDTPDMGVIQIFHSPWTDNRVILVVSGESKTGYDQAIQLLTDPLLQAELDDQLVFVWPGKVAESPQVYTQPIPNLTAVPGVNFFDKLFGERFEPGSLWPTIILVSGGLIVLAIVGIFMLKWNRRRKSASSSGH